MTQVSSDLAPRPAPKIEVVPSAAAPLTNSMSLAQELAPPVELPSVPAPLAVDGFAPASHVGPSHRDHWPQPVTVVLHGNFDRPEWECETWGLVAAARGFVLCPRGAPVQGVDRSLDRWTYPNLKAARRELEAALNALETRYPEKVTRQHMILVGFSLGAIFAPQLAVEDKRYEALFLVEGGLAQLEAVGLPALEAAGVRGLGFAMSGPGRRKQAERWMNKLAARRFPAVYVDMKGAGHNYSSDFAVKGRTAWESLLLQLPSE